MSPGATALENAPASHADTTIVVAEDAEMLGEIVESKLRRAGYRVILKKDGKSAWSAIVKEHPNLVILDWMMPGIDGIHLLSLIRDNPVTHRIPVMMLTAKAEKSEVTTAIHEGANDYMVKPFRTEELVARVERLLGTPL
jgi:DNA-binding response OmpR family regulator